MSNEFTPFLRDPKAYINEAITDIQSVVLNGNPLDDFSNELAKIWGASRALLEGDIELQLKNRIADFDNLCGEELSQRGLEIDLPRRSKTKAYGYAKIKGIIGYPIPQNISFSSSGALFLADTSALLPTNLDAGGNAIIPIISNAFGLGNNRHYGSNGSLASNAIGIENATLEFQASGGMNDESDGEYIARLKYGETLSKAPKSEGWVLFRALRYPRVLRAYLSDCTCCPNEFDIYPLVGGYDNFIPDSQFLQAMQNDVFNTPVGMGLYGSKELGLKINARAAIPKGISINYYGAAGLNHSEKNIISNELASFFKSLGVGASICKSSISNIASLSGGCFGRVEFIFDTAFFKESETHITANCDVLAILNDICFKY